MNLTPLKHLQVVAITGAGALNLTQGQLTCDMQQVQADQATLGALCNREGRVLNVFYVLKIENGFYFLILKDSTDIFINTLKKYAVFYKASIDIVTDMNPYLDTEAKSGIAIPELQASLVLSKTTESDDLNNDIWQNRCITHGIPQIYAKTSGLFLPQELNLTALNAVNFQKGCYTGQEIIARMHYRGQSAKAMFLASIKNADTCQPGQEIYSEDRVIGHLIDAARVSTNEHLALITFSPQKTDANRIYLDPQERTRLDLLSLPYELG